MFGVKRGWCAAKGDRVYKLQNKLPLSINILTPENQQSFNVTFISKYVYYKITNKQHYNH